MPEAGGTATQAGIIFQNTIAALALSELLDLDQRVARERVIEVRVEAPEAVDDIIVRFADDHRDFQNVKITLEIGNSTWARIWQNLALQAAAADFGVNDQLTLMVGTRTPDSESVEELCSRASTSVDVEELRRRLSRPQTSALDSISRVLGSDAAAVVVLQRSRLLHRTVKDVEREFDRRRLAGAYSAPSSLLRILRDIAGGDAARRGLFQAAPLRRRLKLEHDILLAEPPEWGLLAYRETIKRLSRLEIPGIGISGSAEELFVWPRTRDFDRSRPTGFEDEVAWFDASNEVTGIDLRSFPSDQADRVIVVAGPGHGKSALLKAIAEVLSSGPFVPVEIPLASLATADASVTAFLSSSFNREMDLNANWQLLAEQGLLVALFDGLDEVSAAARPMLMQRISLFSARYPKAPWILTVRDAAVVMGLPDAKMVELLPLSDQDIHQFAERMKFYTHGLPAWQVVRKINRVPDLNRLARIPLFLVMLLATVDLDDPSPITRSDLIETYLSTLFAAPRHKAVSDQTDRSFVLRRIAETLAFERLEHQEIGATEREVREVVQRVTANSAEAERLFEQLTINGILKPQSSIRLQFPYPIVQEYLAAHHLVECYPASLSSRIEDAVQRPWAQVIQFALELHPEPEPIMRAMLGRPDDAFCTSLRLLGRCIANGAVAGQEFRTEVGDRLVAYWISAPTDSRERVGRILLEGFTDPLSPKLEDALHHRWLIDYGGGEIICKIKNANLTKSVLSSLLNENVNGTGIYHGLKPAISAAGDEAFCLIAAAMDSGSRNEEEIEYISGLFWHFSQGSVSRDQALKVARDTKLPLQARLRAYEVAGAPLEQPGVDIARLAFRADDWDRHYAARSVVSLHADPRNFLYDLLSDELIPIKRRIDLTGDINAIFANSTERRKFVSDILADSRISAELKIVARLVEMRRGDRSAAESLIESFDVLPTERMATTIALLGHHRDRALAERAAELCSLRALSNSDLAQVAGSVHTGMHCVFEMDWGFGGAVRSATPHPGAALWVELVEDWSERTNLSPLEELKLLTAASSLGSERARNKLRDIVFSISNFDAPEYEGDDEFGHDISSALHEVRRRNPIIPMAVIENILLSSRYNVLWNGIGALETYGTEEALRRLIMLHRSSARGLVRDPIANKIETMSARLQLAVQRNGQGYTLD